jgi:hypothetical protein
MAWNPYRTLFVISCAGLLAATLPPAASAVDDTPILAAKADFDQGLRGDDGAAVDRAAEQFGQLVAQAPASPLLRAYYGSALSLQARHAWAPWTKMKYAESGLDAVDKAIALLQAGDESKVLAGMPVALVTRLVALSTYVAVPDMFHRLGDARDLLEQARHSSSYRSAPPRLLAAYAWQAALVARRDGRAEAEAGELRQVVAVADAPDAPRAAARLRELGR